MRAPYFEEPPAEFYDSLVEGDKGRSSRGFAHISKGVERTRRHLELVREHGIAALGETTGTEALDEVLGQYMEPGRIVLLGGRPGSGKSTLAAQIALEVAARGGQVAVWTGEMSDVGITSRLTAQVGRLNYSRLRRGFRDSDPHRDEWADAQRALDYLGTLGIYLDEEPGVTVETIIERTRKLKAEVPQLRLLVVDYLGLVAPSKVVERSPTHKQYGHVLQSLKNAARELGIAVLVPAQLSRDSVKGGQTREPTQADLREAGEEQADVVAFIYDGELSQANKDRLVKAGKLTPFGGDNDLERYVYTVKVRDGALGIAVLKWVPQQVRFADLNEPIWAEYQPPKPYTPSQIEGRTKLSELLKL